MKKQVNEDRAESAEIVTKYKKANEPRDINHEAYFENAKNKMNEVN